MKNRLLSIDVFRGLTILFMLIVNNPGSWQHVYAPLLHAKWHGCTPTDLVFPFFMYIVGVSLFYSYNKFDTIDSYALRKGIIRSLKIIAIGMLLNWYPFFTKHINDLRLFGVLQRIGWAYMATILILFITQRKWIEWVSISLLILYTTIIYLLGGNDYSLEGNIVRQVDLYLFGANHIYKGFGVPFDPEGLLSTLSAIASILIGFSNAKLMAYNINFKNLKTLVLIGISLTLVGYIISTLGIPINKPMWTSSYVLFTAGFAALVWAILIWIIDFKQWSSGTYFLSVFGKNPIFAFVLSGIFMKTMNLIKWDNKTVYAHMYTNIFQNFFGDKGGSFVQSIFFMIVIWLFVQQLDKKNIIVKV
jgi:predicted acyltransferase